MALGGVVAAALIVLFGVTAAAQFGGGADDAGPPSGPTAAGAPVLDNVTYRIGALTQQGRGGVFLGSPTLGLLRSGPVTSWTVSEAIRGPAGHWTRSGANGVVADGPQALTPQPSGAGVGAHLNGKVYAFKVTAQNARGSSSATITIVVEPDAASMGSPVSTDNYPGAVVGDLAAFEASSPKPKSILVSRGTQRPGGLTLVGFRFKSDVALRDADPAHPSILDNVYLANSSHIKVSGITTDGPGAAPFRFGLLGSDSITFENCQAGRTPASLHKGTYGFRFDGDRIFNIRINNCTVLWQYGGVTADMASRVVIKGLRVRWWHERGLQLGNVSDWLIEDMVILSPRRMPNDETHLDFIQFNDNASLSRVTLRHVMLLGADATTGAQGLFAGANRVSDHLDTLEIDGLVYAQWAVAGLQVNSNAGDSRIHNVTLIKANTGDASRAVKGAAFEETGPVIYVYSGAASNWSGTQAWSHSFVYGDVNASKFASPRFDDTLKRAGGRGLGGYFLNGNPRTTLEAIPFATWEAMSIDQVIQTYRTALLPGPKLQNRDGSYSGAFKPNGEWNSQ
jgi:hypothetical protein